MIVGQVRADPADFRAHRSGIREFLHIVHVRRAVQHILGFDDPAFAVDEGATRDVVQVGASRLPTFFFHLLVGNVYIKTSCSLPWCPDNG